MDNSSKKANNKGLGGSWLYASVFSSFLLLCPLLVSTNLEASGSAELKGELQGDPGGASGFFGDLFGEHIDSNDEWLVLGSPRENVDFNRNGVIENPNKQGKTERQAGAVYIYKKTASGPEFFQKLVAFGNSSNGNGDRFGAGVTLFEGQLFVGAANDPDVPKGAVDPADNGFFFAGKVYVYDYKVAKGKLQWVLSDELFSDEPVSNGAFASRTDANHMIGFPDHGIFVVAEAGNNSGVPGKLHAFKKGEDGWEPAHPPVLSSRFEQFGGLTNLGDRMVRAGDSHLLASDVVSQGASDGRVSVYKVDDGGIVGTLPVQQILFPSREFTINTDARRDILNGFGIPEEIWPDFAFAFEMDNQTFCGFVLDLGPVVGMAAGGNVAAITDVCATQTGNYNQLYGAIQIFTIDESASEPLSLSQVLHGPTDSLFYGSNIFGSSATLALEGERLAVGTTFYQDAFGFPVKGFPIVPESAVDIYRLNSSGQFELEQEIVSPEPSLIPDLGALYGGTVYLEPAAGGSQELLIHRGGWGGQGAGKVYLFELHD